MSKSLLLWAPRPVAPCRAALARAALVFALGPLLPGCAPVTVASGSASGPLAGGAGSVPAGGATAPLAAPARPATASAATATQRAAAQAAPRPAVAPASAPLPAVLAYRDLLKLVNEGRGNPAAVRARLLGRTLQVSLLVTGPRSLMAAREDGVYFICRQRPPSFKGGPVKAEVVAYDEALKGDPMVTLSRCPP
jgi:hypothetical protein